MKSATQILRELADNEQWWELGQSLREIQEHGLHTGNLRNWVDTNRKVLGFSYRTAMFLVQLVRDAERLGYTPAETRRLIAGLKHSKVRIILHRLRRKRAVDALIADYKRMSNPKIDAELSGDLKANFHARISKANHKRLMKLLEAHGVVNKRGAKARGAGPAFDAWLTKVFRGK